MSFSLETIFTDTPEKSRRDVPRIVSRLPGQTFLYRDVDIDNDDYYFVYRHQAVFDGLLSLAGFSLLHDEYLPALLWVNETHNTIGFQFVLDDIL